MRPRIAPEDLPPARPNSPPTREEWLEEALPIIGSLFEDEGYALPPVKVSCSFPGGGSPLKRIGECWPRALSGGSINEIFITPYMDDPVKVLDVLVHECVHAVDDCQSGHGKAFKRIATDIGMEGPMRSASAGPELRKTLEAMAEVLGPYPHVKLKPPPRRTRTKKPPKREFECVSCCDYFWLKAGAADPICCPMCGGDQIGKD